MVRLESYTLPLGGVLSCLLLRDLGSVSATNRRLRFASVVGDTFYSTCVVPLVAVNGGAAGGGVAPCVQAMQPRAATLVTRLRVQVASLLRHATRFVHVREIVLLAVSPDQTTFVAELLRSFMQLEIFQVCALSMKDVGFLTHLVGLRTLDLSACSQITCFSPLASLVHLEHLRISLKTASKDTVVDLDWRSSSFSA